MLVLGTATPYFTFYSINIIFMCMRPVKIQIPYSGNEKAAG